MLDRKSFDALKKRLEKNKDNTQNKLDLSDLRLINRLLQSEVAFSYLRGDSVVVEGEGERRLTDEELFQSFRLVILATKCKTKGGNRQEIALNLWRNSPRLREGFNAQHETVKKAILESAFFHHHEAAQKIKLNKGIPLTDFSITLINHTEDKNLVNQFLEKYPLSPETKADMMPNQSVADYLESEFHQFYHDNREGNLWNKPDLWSKLLKGNDQDLVNYLRGEEVLEKPWLILRKLNDEDLIKYTIFLFESVDSFKAARCAKFYQEKILQNNVRLPELIKRQNEKIQETIFKLIWIKQGFSSILGPIFQNLINLKIIERLISTSSPQGRSLYKKISILNMSKPYANQLLDMQRYSGQRFFTFPLETINPSSIVNEIPAIQPAPMQPIEETEGEREDLDEITSLPTWFVETYQKNTL